jgi:hypothetical protein
VEGSEEGEAVEVVAVEVVVVPPEALLDAHQVVRRVVPDLEALLHPVARVVRVHQVE